MSMAYFTAGGEVPVDRSHAAPAWACTACYACAGSCDHRNPVADVLVEARSPLTAAGVAPAEANDALGRFEAHVRATSESVRNLVAEAHVHPRPRAEHALLIGCGYVRRAPSEANDAIVAARALVGSSLTLLDACCGLPLLLAGAGDRFVQHARDFSRRIVAFQRLTVVDAGCAKTLLHHYPLRHVTLAPKIELLVDRQPLKRDDPA
jgi:Fe-S oxidoreductase